jgi:FkbM family methyltransferase
MGDIVTNRPSTKPRCSPHPGRASVYGLTVPRFPVRLLARLSRRWDRPELLAVLDPYARRDLRDAIVAQPLLAATLRPSATFVDVGANRGQWLRHAVRIAPGGRHLAFEPLPALHAATAEAFPTVDVRDCALSDESGTAEFFAFERYDGFSGLRRRPEIPDAGRAIAVRVSRLDDEIGDLSPAFLKIDVEGGELAVMRGANRVIGEHRPVVVFEHDPRASRLYGASSEDVWNALDDLGYRIFSLGGAGPFGRDGFVDSAGEGERGKPPLVNWLAVPS